MVNRFLLIAYRNVRSHWRQSLAALLSISASFFAYVTFQGYMTNVKDQYYVAYRHRSMLGDVIVENREMQTEAGKTDPWAYSLTREDQAELQAFRERHSEWIKESVRFLRFTGLATNGRASAIFLGSSYDLAAGARMRGEAWAWNAPYGLPLHMATNPESVALGQGLGKILGCTPEKEVFFVTKKGTYEPTLRPLKCATSNVQLSVATVDGPLNALDLEVAGLIDGGYSDIDKRYLMMSLENAQRLNNTDKISIQTFLLTNESLIPQVIKAFDQEVASKRPQLRMMNWQDHPSGDLYKQTMDILGIFRNFVVIVIVSIASLSVFNTMMKIVKERTREIGTLQSLGFHKIDIFITFAWEAVLLTLFGAATGAAFSILFALFVKNVGIFYRAGILSAPVPLLINISGETYLEAAVLLICITISATFLACRKTLRKRIVECLHDL